MIQPYYQTWESFAPVFICLLEKKGVDPIDLEQGLLNYQNRLECWLKQDPWPYPDSENLGGAREFGLLMYSMCCSYCWYQGYPLQEYNREIPLPMTS